MSAAIPLPQWGLCGLQQQQQQQQQQFQLPTEAAPWQVPLQLIPQPLVQNSSFQQHQPVADPVDQPSSSPVDLSQRRLPDDNEADEVDVEIVEESVPAAAAAPATFQTQVDALKYFIACRMAQAQTELPHACAICPKRFASKLSLTLHVMHEHQPLAQPVHQFLPMPQFPSLPHLLCYPPQPQPPQQLPPPQSEPLELTMSTSTSSAPSSSNNSSNLSNTSVGSCGGGVGQSRRSICRVCGKSCSCRSALDIHMRTHTKEKPFACGQCGKRFSTKGNMRQHELTHRRFKLEPLQSQLQHQQQQQQLPPPPPPPLPAAAVAPGPQHQLPQPHQQQQQQQQQQCQVCGKRCPTRSALDIHGRSHTGEKPFACSGCGKRFSTHGNMQAHVRRHCPVAKATSRC